MQTRALSFSAIVLSLLAACGDGKARRQAVGIYHLDAAAMQAAMEARPLDPRMSADDKMLLDLTVNSIGNMTGTLQLHADGTAVMAMTIPGSEVQPGKPGTWSLDGNRLTLSFENAEGVDESRVVTLEQGVITVDQDQGGYVVPMRWHRKDPN